MAQIKIYGFRENLIPIRERLSDVAHECVTEALQFPAEKRALFFPMVKEDIFARQAGTDAYTIIEIAMIAGREAKKKFIRLLFDRINERKAIEKIRIVCGV